MIYMLLLAHLLGDYLFQWSFLARWKARSLLGVLAHGGIVTLTTLICTCVVSPTWWPYALLLGVTHTIIDLVRARFLRTKNPTWELIWYSLDQASHFAVMILLVRWSGLPLWTMQAEQAESAAMPSGRHVLTYTLGSQSSLELSARTTMQFGQRLLAYVIGYVLLLQPAWVLLRFVVRGVCGADCIPALDQGQKYGPMLERVLITTCVVAGYFYLIPVVLLLRGLALVLARAGGWDLALRRTVGRVYLLQHWQRLRGQWIETLLSALLAVGVGLVLRVVGG